MRLAKEFPQDYEMFCYLKDRMLTDPSCYHLFRIPCASCQSTAHKTQCCDMIVIQRSYFKKVYENIFNLQKNRIYFKRKAAKSSHSRLNKSKVQEGVHKMLSHHFLFQEVPKEKTTCCPSTHQPHHIILSTKKAVLSQYS